MGRPAEGWTPPLTHHHAPSPTRPLHTLATQGSVFRDETLRVDHIIGKPFSVTAPAAKTRKSRACVDYPVRLQVNGGIGDQKPHACDECAARERDMAHSVACLIERVDKISWLCDRDAVATPRWPTRAPTRASDEDVPDLPSSRQAAQHRAKAIKNKYYVNLGSDEALLMRGSKHFALTGLLHQSHKV